VDARQANARCGCKRTSQGLRAQRIVGRRHDRIHECRRCIDEDAGGFVTCADDPSALRLPVAGQVATDAAHGDRVGPAGVTIDALEPHRTRREQFIEVRGRRKRLVAPQVLVPAAPEQPGVRWQARLESLEAGDDLGLAARAHEICTQQREAETHQVRMRVDEAGHDGGAIRVVHRCVRGGRAHGVFVTDDRDPARCIPRHCCGDGSRFVQCEDACVHEHAGGALCGRGGGDA